MRETLEKPGIDLERPEPPSLAPDDWMEQERLDWGLAQFRLLWDRRRWLLRALQYGLLVSVIVVLLIPQRFESTARLMPPDSQSNSLATLAALSGRVAPGLGGMAGDLLGLKNTSALFVGILRSQTVQDRLIEKFNLKSVYWAWRIEDAREALDDHTTVIEDRKSGIITITVTDKDPLRAHNLAQAYVNELNRLVAEVSTSAARRERLFIEERLKVVKQELDTAAVEFSKFASKNTAIDIKEQGRAMVEAAATLQGQAIAAQTELQGLRQVYTEQNVRVRAVQARINELQRQLERLGGKAPAAPGTALAGVAGAAAVVEAPSLYPSIRELPILGVTYGDLFRRAKIAEVVYELLTQQYELARVQEAKEIPTVRVLDLPRIPERKSFPPRTLLVLLGTLGALVCTAAWILGTATWERVSPADPRRMFLAEVGSAVQVKAWPYADRCKQWIERVRHRARRKGPPA
jgi:capsule polysaccharide export protein KpsE/RkpR